MTASERTADAQGKPIGGRILMQKYVIFQFIFWSLFGLLSHAQDNQSSWTELGPATLLRTEAFDFDSLSTGRTYRIWVHTPEDYDDSQEYPVVYLMDGLWDIEMTIGIVRRLQFENLVMNNLEAVFETNITAAHR